MRLTFVCRVSEPRRAATRGTGPAGRIKLDCPGADLLDCPGAALPESGDLSVASWDPT